MRGKGFEARTAIWGAGKIQRTLQRKYFGALVRNSPPWSVRYRTVSDPPLSPPQQVGP